MNKSFHLLLAFLTLFVCLTVGISSSALAAQEQGTPLNQSPRTGTLPPPPQNDPAPAPAPVTLPQPQAQQPVQPQPQAEAQAPTEAQQQGQSQPQPAEQAQAESQQQPALSEQQQAQADAILQNLTQKAAAPTQTVNGITCPPEYAPFVQRVTTALMSEQFTFYPVKALDPFVSFIQVDVIPQARFSDEEPKEDMNRPLTPLQKMTVSELEKGLKAITWGDLGRKAVIEDSTGRGYIVSIGTPAGERNGVVSQIFNDRLVIQQEIWDRNARKKLPQDFTIKLSKKTQ